MTITDENNCALILDNLSVGLTPCDTCITPEISTTNIINATCNEDNGSIFIEMVGGNSNYNFDWENLLSDSNFVENNYGQFGQGWLEADGLNESIKVPTSLMAAPNRHTRLLLSTVSLGSSTSSL